MSQGIALQLKTLRRYITGEFLYTGLVSFVVLTFVMSIGAVFKITDLLGRGVAWRPILQIMGAGMPATLMFTIPISTLTASLLVFGRFSADGEITAMRSCGVSTWRITSSPLVVTLLCMLVCLYVSGDIAPRSHLARRTLASELKNTPPIELLEEGRFIQEFAGMTLYVGKRQGHTLQDVRIYDLRKSGIKREVRAGKGLVRMDDEGGMILELRDVRVDPFFDDRPGALFCERWPIRIDTGSHGRGYRPREKDFATAELLVRIQHLRSFYPDLNKRDRAEQRARLLVELNKRWALSAACVAFALLGMPLGIKAHRKESSVGVAISLLLVFSFYLFIIVAESLRDHPALHPELIVWVPVALCSTLGVFLVHRQRA